MKTYKMVRLGIFSLVVAMFMTSCGEEGLLGGLIGEGNEGDESFLSFFEGDGDEDSLDIDLSCVEFVYPITLNNPDGTTSTINNEGEFEQAIDNAIATNTEPTIAFPISVMGENELPQTVNNEEELCDLFWACFEDDYDDCGCEDDFEEECFEINYPITLILPDGTQAAVNNDEELETTVESYYDANPNEEDDFSVVYPVTVTLLEDNSTLTINNDDEFDALFEACYGDDFEECFDLQFPISLTNPDGTTSTANNYEELDSLYEAWFIANPNDTSEPQLVFPITVIYEDGTTEVANDEDELDELYEECFDDYFDCEGMIDGSSLTLGSADVIVERVALAKSKIKYTKENHLKNSSLKQ